MQRTRLPEQTGRGVESLSKEKLQVLHSMLVERNRLASRLGLQQYGGERDIYRALGYKVKLDYDDFYARYMRQDIAKAIIDRPVKATWQGDLELIESEDNEETPFEAGWKMLNWELGIKTRLARVDKLTGIGRYGILFLGLDDVKSSDDFANPVKKGERKLLYVRPFSEATAKISKYETDSANERYGQPVLYEIEVADVENGTSKVVKVHYTRVVHIVDDNLESEVMGTPRLEPVFNRLMDIEKIVGGSAEMFWRGGRPGFEGKLDKEYTLTPDTRKGLIDQFDEYENDLRRFLINEGIELKALTQQISDPSTHIDVQLTMISAETGIPKRVLSGSERGELASTQDVGEWKTYVQSRREDYAEPRIIRPFVDRLIELGILPKPEKFYRIDWLDLFSISEKERVDIGKARANAIREYTTNPLAESIIPPDAFFEFFLGLSSGQIELIHKQVEAGLSEEQKALAEEIKEQMPAPAVIPGNINKLKLYPYSQFEER